MPTIAMLLAQLLPASPLAPPPPIIASVTLPRTERFVVDVEVRAGAETLYAGPMTVGGTVGTSFQRRLSEPAPDECPTPGYGSSAETALSIQLNPQRGSGGGTLLGVAVRWGRTPAGACPFRSNSRAVELNETVALAPGQGVTLTGDGGLVVRLRRR